MNRNLLMPVAVSLILLSGCKYNDDNFEGLDDMTQPTNLMKIEYTLTDADYATISSNSTNKKIATDAGVSKDLENVKTNMYLTEKITGADYIPAFLLDKYYTADKGSSAKITYKYKEAMSSLLSEYASVKYLKPTDAEYKLVYGENAFAPYLNEKTEGQMSKILNEKFKDAEKGTAVFVDYKLGEGQLENPLMWQNFEALPTGDLKELKGWFISSTGDTQWKVTSYDDNQYVQYSANGTKGACVGWMVTPAISVTAGDYLAFDVTVGYYNASCLSVLISENGENVGTANWVDVTSDFSIPTKPTSGYGTFASAGKVSLLAYAGKKVYVAFKYEGDGANKKTTTYQIDNIMVGTSIPANSLSTPTYAVKVYDGKNWKNKSNNVYVLTYADYGDMGQSKRYFTSDVPAVNYLPAYLSRMVAYPVDGDARVVVYRYYNGTDLKIYSDEYTYSAEKARWELNTRIVDKTEQFVLSDGKWNFDPSTVVTLKAEKGDAETAAFYQTITDWVIANKGQEYAPIFSGKSNNEYYYGSSAYQNNFDFRPAKWREQNAAAYGNMSDADLTKLMFERLPEAFLPGLKAIYGSADVVEGVDVFYTINFAIYDGSSTTQYTIKYKVTGKGQFEYVADSLKKVE
jgi:hypothetical protein